MDSDYEIVNSVVHACRSLIMNYGVKNAVVYLETTKNFELLRDQNGIVIDLVKGLSKLHVVSASNDVEKGCALYSISEDINAHLLVRGHVDFDAEIAKFESKLRKAEESILSFRKKTEVDGYEEKVKKEVREENDKRLEKLAQEKDALEKTIANFRALAAE